MENLLLIMQLKKCQVFLKKSKQIMSLQRKFWLWDKKMF